MTTIGKRIRRKRQSLGISQQVLAIAVETSPQHISLIEQDKTHPSVLLVVKLAQELGLTCDYILCGTKGPLTDSIAAIKADKTLSHASKKILIDGIKQLRKLGDNPWGNKLREIIKQHVQYHSLP